MKDLVQELETWNDQGTKAAIKSFIKIHKQSVLDGTLVIPFKTLSNILPSLFELFATHEQNNAAAAASSAPVTNEVAVRIAGLELERLEQDKFAIANFNCDSERWKHVTLKAIYNLYRQGLPLELKQDSVLQYCAEEQEREQLHAKVAEQRQQKVMNAWTQENTRPVADTEARTQKLSAYLATLIIENPDGKVVHNKVQSAYDGLNIVSMLRNSADLIKEGGVVIPDTIKNAYWLLNPLNLAAGCSDEVLGGALAQSEEGVYHVYIAGCSESYGHGWSNLE